MEIKIVKFSLHYFLISAKLEAKRREGCQEDVRALESEISVLNTQVESIMRSLRVDGGERYCYISVSAGLMITSTVLPRARLSQQRSQVTAAVYQLDSQLAAATAEVAAVPYRVAVLQQQANTLAMEAQQRRNEARALEERARRLQEERNRMDRCS